QQGDLVGLCRHDALAQRAHRRSRLMRRRPSGDQDRLRVMVDHSRHEPHVRGCVCREIRGLSGGRGETGDARCKEERWDAASHWIRFYSLSGVPQRQGAVNMERRLALLLVLALPSCRGPLVTKPAGDSAAVNTALEEYRQAWLQG